MYMNKKMLFQPILSICIPTYNRAEFLDKSLRSLTAQQDFLYSDNIEIVISDNNSSDNTELVVKKYAQKFGHKIKYHKNNHNIRDRNFYLVLLRAHGLFRKLSNDTLIYKHDSLNFLIRKIKENYKLGKMIYFSNRKGTLLFETNMNGFIKNVSFNFTWIGCFGLWKHDLKYFKEKQVYDWAEDNLMQCHLLLFLIMKYGNIKIYNYNYCNVCKPSVSGNYDLSGVFIKNYLDILRPYYLNNYISSDTFNFARWDVLKRHVLPRQFNYKLIYSYYKQNFWRNTSEYHFSLYFYYLIIRIYFKKFLFILKTVNS